MKSADGVAGSPSVCAIAVTYRPDRDTVRALVAGVRPQVSALVIVDNDSRGAVAGWLDSAGPDSAGPDGTATVQVLPQPANLGLAAAQNIGISWARAHGHTHVLLLDQDSVAGEAMVATLVDALAELTRTGHRIGAVGPRFHDPREDTAAPFVRVAFPMSEKIHCTDAPYVPCDFLIGSGALIPTAVLDDVGGMDADLFIDNVDLDWSFRARARGYELFGVCAARLDHHLGDDRRAVLFGAGQVVTHSPLRLYYIMRNRVLLYRSRSTPRVWVAQDVIRVPVKFFLFAALIGPRRRNVPMMVHGLADGLRGRRGAFGHTRLVARAKERP